VLGHTRRAAKLAVEPTAIFVGSQGSGKSTVMSRYAEPTKEDDTKPTMALDYSYVRKDAKRESAQGGGGKEVCHLWEIGGGSALASLLEVPLTEGTVKNVLVSIVVDMSKPEEIFPTITFWMDQIRARLVAIETTLRKKPATEKIMDQLRERAAKRFGEKHPDMANAALRKLLKLTGISVLIIAHKADTFFDKEPEMKKIMGKTLRFLAHTNGAGLVYTSTSDKASLNNLRRILNQLLYKEAAVKSKITDHNKDKGHLMVPCGFDTLKDIGQPPADASDTMKQPIELWKSAFESYFGASPPLTAGVGAVPDLDPEGQFAEKDVDETRAQKEEELSLFRQAQERAAAEAAKAASRSRPQGAAVGARAAASKAGGGEKKTASKARSAAPAPGADAGGKTAAAPPSAPAP